ncbi:MAG: ribosome recycling factor [Candidatus Omnitrophica bacterium]|nr:ribosome recycling factor [Candidatus Omnitrophota bacterium]
MIPLQNLYKELEDKMKRALATVTREFGELRGGRASPAFVEHVTVDYYGAATPLKQVAAITAPEPRLIVIQPWDAKLAPEIEKAIQKAGLGISPVVDGKLIRLPIPPLTGERRAELVKLAHRVAEEGRVNIRTLRRDANETVKKLKADKQISEDDAFKGQEQVQKLTDRYIDQIDALVKAKEQELQTT